MTSESETGRSPALVSASDLAVRFRTGSASRPVAINAVAGVDLEIRSGETFGLVGESGGGKSTVGRALVGLQLPTTGKVAFQGEDLYAMSKDELRRRRRQIQIIFQDPFSSLNPRMRVDDTIREPMRIHRHVPKAEQRDRIAELLRIVGLHPDSGRKYPAEFSGGQRQRIGIARALAVNPEFVVLDEPISALDVSVQAQILNLLMEMRQEFGLTYLFIAHDLSAVQHLSHRVAVMYLGKIVEVGDVSNVYDRPVHPYVQALLSAVPIPDPRLERNREQIILGGDLPSPADPPMGCSFHTRCWLYQLLDRPRRCRELEPSLLPAGTGRRSRCHFPDEAQTAWRERGASGRPTKISVSGT